MSNWTRIMREDWDRRAREDLLHYIYCNSDHDLDAFFEEGKRQAIELASPVLQRLRVRPHEKRILEIGCGIGRLFPGFQELGFGEIWGVDLSQEIVERGRQLCPIPRAHFALVNGQDLDQLDNEYFDYCFSYNVFGCIPDKRILWRYMAEVSRVLKPAGVFQLHFRARHRPKARALLVLPRGLHDLARYAYHLLSFSWLTGRPVRSLRQIYAPGDLKTWLGVAVSPDLVAARLRALGFVDVQTFPDHSYKDAGEWFWAVGRKPINKGGCHDDSPGRLEGAVPVHQEGD